MKRMRSFSIAALVLGAGVLIAPAVLMVMLLTGAESDLAGGGCSAEVAATTEGAGGDGLSQAQLVNASTIVSIGLRMGVPRQGILIAVATAHQESRFLNYANDGRGRDLRRDQAGIARSKQLAHDAVGSDHGSLGVFQQQWPWWGTMGELMSPPRAAVKFYSRLLKVPGWESMPVTAAAQSVQRSAYPDAYADDEVLAEQLLNDPRVSAGSVANAVWTGGSSGSMCVSQAVFTDAVVMPLPSSARYINQDNFGARGVHWASTHTGTDFSTPCGTPVLAAHDGRVNIRTDQGWSGLWLVQVSTGEGSLTTWYAHMQSLDVTDGQTVRAGQQIGEVGSEGNSTGCHLHFEVHPNDGTSEDAFDPTEWLEAHAGAKRPQTYSVAASNSFVLATFNVLGHSHTTPGGNKAAWPSSAVRMRGAIELLDRYAVEVVGLQEFEPPQRRALLILAGNRYAVYSPGGDTANSIAWRRDRWALVSADSFPIPYHGGRARQMPIVRLRHLGTGQDSIFVNVHNPADTARFPSNARFRAESLRRETAMSRSLSSRYDLPIFFVGDFNDRTRAFCQLTSGGVLTAAAGGSNSNRCIVPSYKGIDWIFGSQQVRWAGHSAVRRSTVRRISDHPLVVARVERPSPVDGR
jgi:hypothetical protein